MRQIIRRPYITEKSMDQTSREKYTFEIDIKTNKAEVAKEIRKIYKVDVTKVNIVNSKGKLRKYRGKQQGRTNNTKKAIITVKKGQKIKELSVKE